MVLAGSVACPLRVRGSRCLRSDRPPPVAAHGWRGRQGTDVMCRSSHTQFTWVSSFCWAWLEVIISASCVSFGSPFYGGPKGGIRIISRSRASARIRCSTSGSVVLWFSVSCLPYSCFRTAKTSMFSGCINSEIHAIAKRVFEPHKAMGYDMRVMRVIYQHRSGIPGT